MNRSLLIHIVFLSTMLLGNESAKKLKNSTDELLRKDGLPQWTQWSSDEQCKYFHGVSYWYLKNDARAQNITLKNATQRAYEDLSNYLGVAVESAFEMKSTQNGIYSNKKVSHNLQTKSAALVYDIQPLKTHIQSEANRMRHYVLLCLDTDTEKKLKKENEQDKREFEQLIEKVTQAIEMKKFYEAKNFLAQAKGKRNAFMNTQVASLEERIKKIYDNLIEVKLELADTLTQDSPLEFRGTLTQTGFLYIFDESTRPSKLIYPLSNQRVEQLWKNNFFDSYNLMDDYMFNEKEVKLTFVASKAILLLKKHSKEINNNSYLFDKSVDLLEPIKQCLEENRCTIEQKTILITSKYDFLKMDILITGEKNFKNKITQALKPFSDKKSTIQLRCNIYSKTKYSSLLGKNITTSYAQITLQNNGKKKTKDVGLDDELDSFFEAIDEMLAEF